MTRKETANFIHLAALSVQKAIDSNPLSRKSVTQLVPDLYVGRNQLQTAFKQLTKQTIKRYRLIKRMEAARDLLSSEVESVKEVALQCGYRNPGNFNKDFKEVFNKTPGEWLNDNLKNKYNGYNQNSHGDG
ncbi:helix-turn-helix domain-containing protein [Niastella caeni]|nr:AraC family transcriptional regulator [Niastella caeni]